MSVFDRRHGGRNRGTLRPDLKEKRQREAIERQVRYEDEVSSGMVDRGQSLHWFGDRSVVSRS